MKFKEITKLLSQDKIGVMPTDTIYGIVGSALNPNIVEEIYRLRKRAEDKPMIILISDLNDLNHFHISLTNQQRDFLQKNWPNPLSVVLPCNIEKFTYLHRGKKSLAFRMPKSKALLKILQKAGPLVAPSANFEGEKPAENIDEAKKYFGEKVAFYIDKGEIKSKSSTMIKLKDNSSIAILRQGSFKLSAEQMSQRDFLK